MTMFKGALFTIAKTWKQPRCPLTDEWVKIYRYTMGYCSAIKKKQCHLQQHGQTQKLSPSKVKDKYCMISLICLIYKHDTNELIYKIQTDSDTQKTILWLPKWKWKRGINQEFVVNRYTPVYIK